MKKQLLLLLLPFMAILNSCQKIQGTVITGTNTGTSATYQPLTAGSTWKYRTDYSAMGYPSADTSTITMGSKTLTINNKLYTEAYETLSGFTNMVDTGYYYASNHEYSTMEKIPTGSSTYIVELLYLKDNVPVGSTWSGTISYPTLGSVISNGKITEKGISKTVAGKTFNNVIHTTVKLTMTILGTANTFTYEIYVAPNVGIIHIDLIEPGYGTIPEDLISYNIK